MRMKYLAIFIAMLVLAYVFSRPDTSPRAAQRAELERAIAAHEVTTSMSASDVLKSLGAADAITSTPSGQIIWGYRSGKYVVLTVNGVVTTGTLGPGGEPYFTGKDAQKLRR